MYSSKTIKRGRCMLKHTKLAKIAAAIGSLLCITVIFIACSNADQIIANPVINAENPEILAIHEQGQLRVGVKDDSIGMGFFNLATGQYEGLEIDIAHLLAEHILGDPELIEFIPVSTDTRGALLNSGRIDLVIASFTIREERKEFWNFSTPYFMGMLGLLVNRDSGLRGLEDFDGKTIAVTTGSAAPYSIQDHIEEMGYDIEVNFLELGSNQDCYRALQDGSADAFSIDKSTLARFRSPNQVILPCAFRAREYGIATRKENPYLTEVIDDFVNMIIVDGTLDRLKEENHVLE